MGLRCVCGERRHELQAYVRWDQPAVFDMATYEPLDTEENDNLCHTEAFDDYVNATNAALSSAEQLFGWESKDRTNHAIDRKHRRKNQCVAPYKFSPFTPTITPKAECETVFTKMHRFD
jgi:hypothetical protein